MVDPDRILRTLLGNPAAAGLAGGALGLLLGRRSGRRLAGKALQAGAIAALAGMAWNAWVRSRRGGGAAAAEPPPDRFLPRAGEDQRELGLVLVRAMLAAARADGRLDPQESERLLRRLADADFSADERALVLNELAADVDIDGLVAAAQTKERAAEMYLAARSAVDVDTPAEEAWMRMFATRLGLDGALVSALEAELGDPQSAAPRARNT